MADPPHRAVAGAIRQFREAPSAASGEQPAKVEAINTLEAHLAVQEARAFVLQVLQDPNEYDLARVEACKALLVHESPSPEATSECAQALVAVLGAEGDTLVRQWVAKALANFVTADGVVSALVSATCNPAEDEDVRHNTLASLHRASLTSADRTLLAGAIDDPQLGWAITRYLKEREA